VFRVGQLYILAALLVLVLGAMLLTYLPYRNHKAPMGPWGKLLWLVPVVSVAARPTGYMWDIALFFALVYITTPLFYVSRAERNRSTRRCWRGSADDMSTFLTALPATSARTSRPSSSSAARIRLLLLVRARESTRCRASSLAIACNCWSTFHASKRGCDSRVTNRRRRPDGATVRARRAGSTASSPPPRRRSSTAPPRSTADRSAPASM
jgi:hypothetical protein